MFWPSKVNPVSHSTGSHISLRLPGCFYSGVWAWIKRLADCDLERPQCTEEDHTLVFQPIKTSNTASLGKCKSYKKIQLIALRGKNTTVLTTGSPETCAKSSSCTTFYPGLLKLTDELVSERSVCVCECVWTCFSYNVGTIFRKK